MQKNVLVQYDGGGYDGCIWEWNYFYIDTDGIFKDVQSSGVGGITTKLAAMLLIENNGNSFSNKVFIYRLDNEEDMRTFATETACPHVLGVIRWFNDYNSPEAEPFAICSECKCKIVDVDEIQLIDIHGCGGIMSTADNLLCSQCWSAGRCDRCEEYCKDVHEYEEEYLCEYCIEEAENQKKSDNQEEMLFQALTTGEPDMFSDDMRWLWI